MLFARKNILVLLSLFLLCPVTYAEVTKAGNDLSLQDALSIAFKNNPQMVEMRKKIKIAESRQKNAKKFANPELDIDIEKLAYDLEGQGTFDKDNLEGEVRITQLVQTGGKRGLGIGIAQHERSQVEYEYQSLWLDVTQQVKEQYAEALLQQKYIELSKDSLERAQRLLEQVNIKFNAGIARNHELARTKLELANVRNDLLNAEIHYYVALGKLNILLGQKIQEAVHLSDNLSVNAFKEKFEELLNVALNQNTEILSQNHEVEKREKQLKLAKRQRLPDMNIGLFVEREEEIYSAGAGISFELPLWNQFQEEIKEASLEKEIAEIHLETLKKEVELELYASFKNAELAGRSVDNLEQAIREANELLRIIAVEYQEGETSFLSYLEGLASYKKTKQDYLESLVNYANKLSVLELAVGKAFKNEEDQL